MCFQQRSVRAASNPRPQRTRFALLRSPLSRKPLGHQSLVGTLVITFIVFAAYEAILGCTATTPSRVHGPPTAERAHALAEEAFLKYTERKITAYSIKDVSDGGTEWEFFVQGTKQFARPGYHWLVKVDRESGAASVEAGE